VLIPILINQLYQVASYFNEAAVHHVYFPRHPLHEGLVQYWWLPSSSIQDATELIPRNRRVRPYTHCSDAAAVA